MKTHNHAAADSIAFSHQALVPVDKVTTKSKLARELHVHGKERTACPVETEHMSVAVCPVCARKYLNTFLAP